jgi:hypothetical protein
VTEKKPRGATRGESENQQNNQNQTGQVNTMQTSTHKSEYLPLVDAALVLEAHQHPTVDVPMPWVYLGIGQPVLPGVIDDHYVLVHSVGTPWPSPVSARRVTQYIGSNIASDVSTPGFQWGYDDPDELGVYTFTSLGRYYLDRLTLTGVESDGYTPTMVATFVRVDVTEPTC